MYECHGVGMAVTSNVIRKLVDIVLREGMVEWLNDRMLGKNAREPNKERKYACMQEKNEWKKKGKPNAFLIMSTRLARFDFLVMFSIMVRHMFDSVCVICCSLFVFGVCQHLYV